MAVLAGGAIATGLLCAAPLILLGNGADVSGHGLALLAACFGIGTVGLPAASALSRPLLRAVTQHAGPRPE